MGKLGFPGGREAWLALGLAALLLLGAAAAYHLTRPTTLTLAVAPSGGTEPALLRAYADELARRKLGIRLKVVPFGGVRESAEALKAGRADLAVVRPDVAMPGNGLTLAVLRELAVLVVAPGASGIRSIPDLAGKRLGMLASRTADRTLVGNLVAQHGLDLPTEAAVGTVPTKAVALAPVEEADIPAALRDGRIDAMALVTTPTSPAARRVVGLVREASADDVALFGAPDAAAVLARWPRLQPVTVPATLFGGSPRLPAEDVATVGSSYRLMARADLSRSVASEVTQHLFEMRAALAETVPAAEEVSHPDYEDTADATSARLPIHPGAIDYYEREQETFIERYESWIYLVAILAGGVGSTLAWLRRRLGRIRRERIEVATARLLELRTEARRETDRARLDALAGEVDDLAGSIARHALNRPTEPRTLGAATVAIDAARSTVKRALSRAGSPTSRPTES
ncbi:TAXI family TRAP transporter solute-binding subunit [Methylobacterium radiodurans]|uniref:C4-dicarboxylate ABC transporter substrate-binding protein n=1 Tax=Methylobacterium radiodurans TaxID=2202828 RepID=A0A2U8VMM5_9HYPH|nr:TAXI family TRAP transporter solute-binding subunit [Methylobacterium radiodurans]AWN34671.1 C4-dicarboxylate ABC transporter substrate-binding protein [Methylobacterium radiodurans]